jgi:hypothetical protein
MLLSEIDLFVFVPIEKNDFISCDSGDFPKLRRQVDDLLQDWIYDLDMQVIEVKGTILDRSNQILAKIKS